MTPFEKLEVLVVLFHGEKVAALGKHFSREGRMGKIMVVAGFSDVDVVKEALRDFKATFK